MKNLKISAVFFLVAAILSSCGGVKKMVKESDTVGYSVDPTVLVMRGGKLTLPSVLNILPSTSTKKLLLP